MLVYLNCVFSTRFELFCVLQDKWIFTFGYKKTVFDIIFSDYSFCRFVSKMILLLPPTAVNSWQKFLVRLKKLKRIWLLGDKLTRINLLSKLYVILGEIFFFFFYENWIFLFRSELGIFSPFSTFIFAFVVLILIKLILFLYGFWDLQSQLIRKVCYPSSILSFDRSNRYWP